jgi:oligoendopeptidase F
MTTSTPTTGAENIIWDLSDLYSGYDDPAIEADTADLQALLADFVRTYKGKLAHMSASDYHNAYVAMEAIYELVSKQYTFASLQFSTNATNPQVGAFLQRCMELYTDVQQQLVFFEVEWNALPDDQAQALLDHPDLATYRHQLAVARMGKPYQLSEAEERLLIAKSVTSNEAWTRLFDQIMSSLKLDFDGDKLPMPQVLSKLQHADRDTRKRAADAITAILRERNMELTYIYNTVAADKASTDKLRGYPSWITPRNIANQAPDAVVNALIDTVTGSYELVARHYRLKRRLLGYDELFDYDRYAPLALKQSEGFYTWEEARTMVLNAFASFSTTVASVASHFFEKNWIHAPVMAGKRGGAFASYGTKSTHPYVFVNYTGTANDVMTLAHELGHGVHMYLANQNQTLTNMYTPLTTAEMASTFAEMVVFNDLMARESSEEARLAMLAKKVEDSFATIYRQVSMNRFEDAMHTARRQEGELSSDRLSELWATTQQAMFGDSVTLREDYRLWWSYIPHFLHTPGYVYAYAFGELLVLALYNLYRKEGASFVPKYEQLLSSGGSDTPSVLLARVGVNLDDPNFWQEGVQALRDLIDQEEALADKLYPAE